MYHTIQISSCLSIQGEFVEAYANGDVAVRDGSHTYRGQPIKRLGGGITAFIVQALDGCAPRPREGV